MSVLIIRSSKVLHVFMDNGSIVHCWQACGLRNCVCTSLKQPRKRCAETLTQVSHRSCLARLMIPISQPKVEHVKHVATNRLHVAFIASHVCVCESCSINHVCTMRWDTHEPFDEPCDSHLACAVEMEPPPDQVIGDPEDMAECAIRTEFKRLQEEEDQRKGDLGGIGSRYGYVRFSGVAMRLPREVRNQLAKLHGHFGHPSNERLARMLQINGAHKSVIEGAKLLRCSICERISGPRSAPQASSKAPGRFNEQCVLDSFFVLDCSSRQA